MAVVGLEILAKAPVVLEVDQQVVVEGQENLEVVVVAVVVELQDQAQAVQVQLEMLREQHQLQAEEVVLV